MKKRTILIVAATENEIKPAISLITSESVDYFITGVGMVNTCLNLYEHIKDRNDIAFLIQAGIGGSFSRDLKIGDVVNVVSEALGDTGVETASSFKTLSESGWEDVTELRNKNRMSAVEHLEQVDGITVAMACGSERTAALRKEKFNATIESMEGVPFYMLCQKLGIPFAEIRSVSNYCGPHKDGNWNSELAIKNLAAELIVIIKKLENEL